MGRGSNSFANHGSRKFGQRGPAVTTFFKFDERKDPNTTIKC